MQSNQNRSRRTMRRRAPRAFTLVEILVVVAIIALLAGTVAWRVLGSLNSARVNTAQAKASQIASALSNYYIDGGNLEDGMDLGVLLQTSQENNMPGAPYLNKADALLDPWDRQYTVRVPGQVNHDFDVISAGPDGVLGNEDDITN